MTKKTNKQIGQIRPAITRPCRICGEPWTTTGYAVTTCDYCRAEGYKPTVTTSINRDEVIEFLIKKAEEETARADKLQQLVAGLQAQIDSLTYDLDQATATKVVAIDKSQEDRLALLGFRAASIPADSRSRGQGR